VQAVTQKSSGTPGALASTQPTGQLQLVDALAPRRQARQRPTEPIMRGELCRDCEAEPRLDGWKTGINCWRANRCRHADPIAVAA
jgi:hypothetical protein